MEKFYCEKCEKIFESEGIKKEWQSSVFGKCWKLIAKCPSCGEECKEYRPFTGGKLSKNQSCKGNCSLCTGCK